MAHPDPDMVLERLRGVCLALPEAEETTSHGIPAFRAGGRMFAYFRHDHHGDDMTVVCVKTSGREEQEMLLEADPALYSRPPYLWPSGWIALDLVPDDTDWDHVAARVGSSHALATAPKGRAAPRGRRSGAISR